MKTKLFTSIGIEIISTALIGLILKTNNMEIWIILIIIGIVMIVSTTAYYSITDKFKRYNHANNIQLFTHLSIIQKLFKYNTEIAEEYMRDIEGMGRLNPLDKQTLDDLFIFDKNSNYKVLIENLNKQINKQQ